MTTVYPKVKLEPTCDRAAAIRRYSGLMLRIIISQAIVSSALQVPRVSDKLAQEILRNHLMDETGLADALSELLRPLDPATPSGQDKSLELLAEGIAKQAVINTEMVIAAAAVLLSHSTADDVFTAALKIAIDLDPNGWLSEINLDQRVTLEVVCKEGPERLLAWALKSFRNQLGRKESLPTRADLLFRHVKILHNSKFDAKDPRRFKSRFLKEADDLRVEIVHGTGLPKIDIEHSHRIMLFLHEAAFTAIRSVADEFKLSADLEYLRQLVTSNEGTTVVNATHSQKPD